MKRGYILVLISTVLVLLSLSNGSGFISTLAIFGNCKDTLNNKCAIEQPFLCQDGQLIKNCNVCGCGPGYLCNSITNECELADYCEQAQGICQGSCDSNLIEFVPLTQSCNAGEMINNNIILTGESIALQVKLENTNEFASIIGISTLAYIEEIPEANDGFFLDIIEPLSKFKKELFLNMPENFDSSRSYKLIFIISYQDKQEKKEFTISSKGDYFVYTIRNIDFVVEDTEVKLSEDLKYSINIINRKCCVPSIIKTESPSFIGYCDNKVPYNKCSLEKPLFCDNGLLIEDCIKCGCPNNFICNENKKCENIILKKEIEKFFSNIKADSVEEPILRFLGYKFARVAKSPITPEYITINKELNQISVKTEDVDLKITKTEETPRIDVEITGY